jgi:hypothetical protein
LDIYLLFSSNVANFPNDGETLIGNAFEFYQFSICGGNVPSGFRQTATGTVIMANATQVSEPK